MRGRNENPSPGDFSTNFLFTEYDPGPGKEVSTGGFSFKYTLLNFSLPVPNENDGVSFIKLTLYFSGDGASPPI